MAMIIGKKIIHYGEIDSTNNEAKRLIGKGLGEGTLVVADLQTKGRGKPGSGFFSPPQGVYLSAVIKPYRSPKDLSSITLLGSRSVVNTIEKISQLKAEIKLPNDVMINGKKVSGVLVERLTSGHLIIGIGVNINNSPGSFPDELSDSATSLRIESGKNFSQQEFIDQLVSELDQEYLAYLNKI
jgi:BirA family biotin operon repressor/biotin-[acetyl-CoA-carboxylase] ligase